ncbi:hypothetical protein ACFE04_021114 [Oxalis oulophora]
MVEDRADKLDSQIGQMKVELGQHEAGLADLRQQVKETKQLLSEARAALNLDEVEIAELKSANASLQKAATDREAERTQQALDSKKLGLMPSIRAKSLGKPWPRVVSSSEVEKLKKAVAKLRNQNEGLKVDLKNAQAQIEEMFNSGNADV